MEAGRLDALSYVKLYSGTANEVPHLQKSMGNVMGMSFAGWAVHQESRYACQWWEGNATELLGPRCKLASQTTRPARTLERFESGVLLCLLWLSFTLREPELGGCEARIGFGQ